MLIFNVSDLDREIFKALNKYSVKLEDEIISSLPSAFVTPNAITRFGFRALKNKQDFYSLCCFSWYLKNFGVYLRLDLEELVDTYCHEIHDKEVAMLLLNSKESMLSYMSTYHPRELFGNWIPRMRKQASFVEFKTLFPSEPKPTVFRRGYKDKGSADLLHPKAITQNTSYYEFDDIQNQLEEKREFLQNVHSLIRREGLLAVRLPELE
jgi:hypothetical protein